MKSSLLTILQLQLEWDPMYWTDRVISYQNPVRIHDCIQSVGNGQDSAIRELVTYCLLNYGISPAREESQPYLTTNGSWSVSHTGYDKVDVKST